MTAIASSDRGFTLLEVMIALAILATTLVTLLGLSNRSIASNARVQKLTRATLLAQQKMSEIEVLQLGGGRAYDEDEGAFEPPFEAFRWEVRYADTPLPSVRQVQVSVAWGDPAKQEVVELTSFLFH